MPNVADELDRLAEASRRVARPVIVVVMGVSGSGKTTIAKLLSDAIGCQFQEGDELHPQANVDRMRAGAPLTDADRLPWLMKIADEIDTWRSRRESGVLTCSALKRAYRDLIIGARRDVTLVFLSGSRDLIGRRMAARRSHFMPVALLDSQFATLEPPGTGEDPIIVDVEGENVAIASEILRDLAARQADASTPK